MQPEPAGISIVPGLSAAVLAGGASSRMGQDKARLQWQGKQLVDHVVERVSVISDDVMVITNMPEKYDFLADRVRFVPDAWGPGQGPLVGIASALAAAHHPRVLVVATDMPFLHVPLLDYLARLEPEADVVVPVVADDGFPETLHAIYHQRVLPIIERSLREGRRKITSFFSDVRVREVTREEITSIDPALRSFFNANTPAEWARAERIASGEA